MKEVILTHSGLPASELTDFLSKLSGILEDDSMSVTIKELDKVAAEPQVIDPHAGQFYPSKQRKK